MCRRKAQELEPLSSDSDPAGDRTDSPRAGALFRDQTHTKGGAGIGLWDQLERRYWALVMGAPAGGLTEGRVSAPLAEVGRCKLDPSLKSPPAFKV